MTDHSVKHSTFTLERTYAAAPAAVFAAWSDRETKAKWFAAQDSSYALDFRIGGAMPYGTEVRVRARATGCVRRRGGARTIVHEYAPVPFAAATGHAVPRGER